MILIIDGYNLLFAPCWGEWGKTLEEKREHLLQKIGQYQSHKKISRTIVVFDGQANISPYPSKYSNRIEIIYATGSGKADEKIVALSADFPYSQIVTADREIIRQAKRNKATIVSPEQFLRHLQISQKNRAMENIAKERDLTTDEWLEIFGLAAEITFDDKEHPKNKVIPKKKQR